MISRKKARKTVRRAVDRLGEGETISHLNIMPMMDMMTILLVAFLAQSAAAGDFSVGDVQIPGSSSYDPPPEGAVTITISKKVVTVQGNAAVSVRDGNVDASDRKGGALGTEIPKLSRLLGGYRKAYEADMRANGKEPPKVPEVIIIADKATPYRLLFQVIASAKTDDAGFRRFRLIVLQSDKLAGT